MNFWKTGLIPQSEVINQSTLKQELLLQLKEAIKCMLNEYQPFVTIKTDDSSSYLCSVLESILLHGLRETIFHKMSYFFSQQSPHDVISFWSFCLIFSHKDLLHEIDSLSQIKTDVGKSRAWLRLALNQGSFLAYLISMFQDVETLDEYYHHFAFVRDHELSDLFVSILRTLQDHKFNLAFNSEVLNTWTNLPLKLAGIYFGDPDLEPVVSAKEASEDVSSPRTLALGSTEISMKEKDVLQQLGITSDEAFNIILTPTNFTTKLMNELPCDETDVLSLNGEFTSGIGVEFHGIVGKNIEEEDDPQIDEGAAYSQESYKTILQKYSTSAVPKVECHDDYHSDKDSEINIQESVDALVSSFEILPSDFNDFCDKTSIGSSYLAKIVTNKGLSHQKYLCHGCSRPVGMIYGPGNFCWLSGYYFCDDCFGVNRSIIPSRILHNWDFTEYPISTISLKYLEGVFYMPLLDVYQLNPMLYAVVPELEELQTMRRKLHYIRAYLLTCKQSVAETLKKKMWPRDYLFEHVHLYSVKDFTEINNLNLHKVLRRIIEYGMDHISECLLCSLKGFICEICKDSRPIFPFNLDSTFRCQKCYSVYHKLCKTHQSPCPKCIRLDSRKGSHEYDNNSE